MSGFAEVHPDPPKVKIRLYRQPEGRAFPTDCRSRGSRSGTVLCIARGLTPSLSRGFNLVNIRYKYNVESQSMLGDRDYMKNNWSAPGHMGHRESSAVKKLIIINIVVYFAQLLTEGVPTRYTGDFLHSQGGITSYLWLSEFWQPELWRFITYMFVHGPFFHIFLNMWVLFVVGKIVEGHIGTPEFLKIYFLSGFIGGAFWLLFNFNANAVLVGASAGLAGIVIAAALLLPDMKMMLIFPPVVMKIKTLVTCLIIIDFILMISPLDSGVAHTAHLGGYLAGFLLVKKYINSKNLRGPRKRNKFSFPLLFKNLKQQFSSFFNPSTSSAPDLQFVTDEDELDDDESINAKIDPILDKIGKFGMKSMTNRERQLLDRAREKLKNRK